MAQRGGAAAAVTRLPAELLSLSVFTQKLLLKNKY